MAWFTTYLTELPAWVATGLRIVLIIMLAWLAAWMVRRLIARLGHAIAEQTDSKENDRRIATLTSVARYIAAFVILVITVLLILSELNVAVAPLLGAAGIVGIAVGFGAQSLVKDFFTGFFLLLDDQIRAGDVVKAAGHGGLVEDINLRRVKLRDYEGNVHYIPNGAISTVTNMSRGFAFAVMDLAVAYTEDVDTVKQVLRQIGESMRNDPDFSPSLMADLEIAGVDRLDDSAVIVKCRFKCVALDQWKIKREFLARSKAQFQAQGIEIPFPHLRVLN